MGSSRVALIVGAGSGLSASLARRFSADGMKIALAARDIPKLDDLTALVDGRAYACDASDPGQVAKLFADVADQLGAPELVVYNASRRVRGAITDIDPAEVKTALMTTVYGGFLVGQQAARLMIPAGGGTILFTGASAGVKGFANSATFAMGKFGLRGLAQSMARELQPQNIHVAHVVIDGGILNPETGRGPVRAENEAAEDIWLIPDKISETYHHLHHQHRSAWAWEIELRPWVEKF